MHASVMPYGRLCELCKNMTSSKTSDFGALSVKPFIKLNPSLKHLHENETFEITPETQLLSDLFHKLFAYRESARA